MRKRNMEKINIVSKEKMENEFKLVSYGAWSELKAVCCGML